ncbi:MAG: MBL fold metallo-hydrolase [Planctomycetes bacterium]|nr:MBL fold metallo-hydrolase [Planctomycetota bacterium]
MPARFHVLASGSSGNACVVEADGVGVLIDFGLSPRALAPRMKQCRLTWNRIDAVVLTHDHTDHWNATTLSHLATLRLPIYCHAEHKKAFNAQSRAFAALDAAGLFRHYEPGESIDMLGRFRCEPIELSHDGAMTCGFRFEGNGWAIGYAADLGCWTSKLARQLADVDVLALEFNHDVPMQLSSGRHPLLIRRVLGDQGHLSNEQAAGLLAEVLRASVIGRMKHLVQLHLSRECNDPQLAKSAAQAVLDRLGVALPIYTAVQGRIGPSLTIGKTTETRRRVMQPHLPFDD